MDVLKPPILNIDGRCYRLNPVQRPSEWVEHEDEMEGYDEMYDGMLCDVVLQTIWVLFPQNTMSTD